MSDPVKNVEIEDVLSSIRRLVTEEGREKPKAGAKLAQPVGRLVLTESLRVTEDAPEAEDAAGAEMVDESATDQTPEAPVRADETGEVLTLGRDFRAVSYADEIEFRRDASRLRRGANPPEPEAEDKATAKPGPKDVTYDLPKTPVGEFAEARTPWKRPEATLHEAAEVAAIAPEPSQEDDPKPEAVAAEPLQQAAAMRSA
ncbi:MAG: hypothetical protein VXW58_00715, partial [Pseudomonadota bacterium]|nr:hypothetical protein [Pseudomonadota bacterium]